MVIRDAPPSIAQIHHLGDRQEGRPILGQHLIRRGKQDGARRVLRGRVLRRDLAECGGAAEKARGRSPALKQATISYVVAFTPATVSTSAESLSGTSPAAEPGAGPVRVAPALIARNSSTGRASSQQLAGSGMSGNVPVASVASWANVTAGQTSASEARTTTSATGCFPLIPSHTMTDRTTGGGRVGSRAISGLSYFHFMDGPPRAAAGSAALDRIRRFNS